MLGPQSCWQRPQQQHLQPTLHITATCHSTRLRRGHQHTPPSTHTPSPHTDYVLRASRALKYSLVTGVLKHHMHPHRWSTVYHSLTDALARGHGHPQLAMQPLAGACHHGSCKQCTANTPTRTGSNWLPGCSSITSRAAGSALQQGTRQSGVVLCTALGAPSLL